MSPTAYWLWVLYAVAMVVMACSSYNFMYTHAPKYDIALTVPVKAAFLGGALIFGVTWPLWLTISIINFVRRRKNHESGS